MAAVLVLIVFLVVIGAQWWLRSRKTTLAPEVALLPMKEPSAPSGVFLHEGHSWARMSTDGSVRVGIDAFLAEVLGDIEDVKLPPRGQRVRRGEPLFRIRSGERTVEIPSPIQGEVVMTHDETRSRPWLLSTDPYGVGWALALRTKTMKASLSELKTGASATAFLRAELQKWVDFLSRGTEVDGQPILADGAMPLRGAAQSLDDEKWDEFVRGFVPTDDE